MEIGTEHLVLRKVLLSDLDRIHRLHSSPEVDKYNTLGIPASVAQTRNHLLDWMEAEKEPRKKMVFCIEDRRKDFVGLIGINFGKPGFMNAEVWYKLNPEQWNKGYATEALKAVLQFCFADLKLHRVEAGCAEGNHRSARVMEKAGMRKEGTKRKNLPIRGNWVDADMYAILEDEFAKQVHL